MCLYFYTVLERNHDKRSSEKSFEKLIQSSTILFYGQVAESNKLKKK